MGVTIALTYQPLRWYVVDRGVQDMDRSEEDAFWGPRGNSSATGTQEQPGRSASSRASCLCWKLRALSISVKKLCPDIALDSWLYVAVCAHGLLVKIFKYDNCCRQGRSPSSAEKAGPIGYVSSGRVCCRPAVSKFSEGCMQCTRQ